MRAVKVQPKEFLTEIASANQKLEKWESGRPYKGQAFPLYAVSKVIYQKYISAKKDPTKEMIPSMKRLNVVDDAGLFKTPSRPSRRKLASEQGPPSGTLFYLHHFSVACELFDFSLINKFHF